MSTADPELSVYLQRHIREVAAGVSSVLGGGAEVTLHEGYGALVNRSRETKLVLSTAQALFGSER